MQCNKCFQQQHRTDSTYKELKLNNNMNDKRWNCGTDSTYKELKPTLNNKVYQTSNCTDSTYKELKHGKKGVMMIENIRKYRFYL